MLEKHQSQVYNESVSGQIKVQILPSFTGLFALKQTSFSLVSFYRLFILGQIKNMNKKLTTALINDLFMILTDYQFNGQQ